MTVQQQLEALIYAYLTHYAVTREVAIRYIRTDLVALLEGK